MIDHPGEDGQPCRRHRPVDVERVLELAWRGVAMRGLVHDVVSKTQGLGMTLELGTDLATGADLREILGMATTAARELGAIVSAQRNVAERRAVALAELVALAGKRAQVRVHGNLAAEQITCDGRTIAQVLELVFRVAAGPARLERAVALSSRIEGDALLLEIVGPAGGDTGHDAAEYLGLASFALRREHGWLRCAPARYVVAIPRH